MQGRASHVDRPARRRRNAFVVLAVVVAAVGVVVAFRTLPLPALTANDGSAANMSEFFGRPTAWVVASSVPRTSASSVPLRLGDVTVPGPGEAPAATRIRASVPKPSSKSVPEVSSRTTANTPSRWRP